MFGKTTNWFQFRGLTLGKITGASLEWLNQHSPKEKYSISRGLRVLPCMPQISFWTISSIKLHKCPHNEHSKIVLRLLETELFWAQHFLECTKPVLSNSMSIPKTAQCIISCTIFEANSYVNQPTWWINASVYCVDPENWVR